MSSVLERRGRAPSRDVRQPPTPTFPRTRYQGSKAKLVEWIGHELADLDFSTCLDAFGGTGAVAYALKRQGKTVTYNDDLRFNHLIARALIENDSVRLGDEEVDELLAPRPGVAYPSFVRDTFDDVYFTRQENAWIDRTITNIRRWGESDEAAVAFFALCQACIVKRPYNLFHRKNLYMRLAEVPRSFGNKASWDRPFDDWFRHFVAEANRAVFDNGRANRSLNHDAMDVPGEYDLVYIDPPYVSSKGAAVDYWAFYHFLEGLTMYDDWGRHVDRSSKHRRLLPRPSPWTSRDKIAGAFERLFERYRRGILVVSYRGDDIPAEAELVAMLERHKRNVRVSRYGRYKYALSTNAKSSEILIIGV